MRRVRRRKGYHSENSTFVATRFDCRQETPAVRTGSFHTDVHTRSTICEAQACRKHRGKKADDVKFDVRSMKDMRALARFVLTGWRADPGQASPWDKHSRGSVSSRTPQKNFCTLHTLFRSWLCKHVTNVLDADTQMRARHLHSMQELVTLDQIHGQTALLQHICDF